MKSNEILWLGNVCPTKTRANPNQGRVYDPSGICPALNCKGGGIWKHISYRMSVSES